MGAPVQIGRTCKGILSRVGLCFAGGLGATVVLSAAPPIVWHFLATPWHIRSGFDGSYGWGVDELSWPGLIRINSTSPSASGLLKSSDTCTPQSLIPDWAPYAIPDVRNPYRGTAPPIQPMPEIVPTPKFVATIPVPAPPPNFGTSRECVLELSGWPFPAFHGAMERRAFAPGEGVTRHGALAFGDPTQNLEDEMFLPLHIIPAGFALDWATWTGGIAFFWFVPLYVRRLQRARAGKCLGCGYPCVPGAVCAECGRTR